ncbi:hypothetical protein [Paenibacillus mesotrionivorans]|uniref:Uncharacterized protein n=1 Tax=Paenibacillus mesotrionivorans TaxID=3160968 RepID=A0ACC7NW01_9BACL
MAVESVFQDIPVLLYHRLDSVASYLGFQSTTGQEQMSPASYRKEHKPLA